MLRHLTIGQTLSIQRNGGLVQVAALHNAMLEVGLSSQLAYVDWDDGLPAPQASTRLNAAFGNPFFFGWTNASRIRSLVQQADVVHLHGMYTYLNFVAGRFCQRYGKALIYHPHGALVPAFLNSGRLKKTVALRAFERENFRRLTAWRALTPTEAQQIRDFEPRATTFVVPNGVALPKDTAKAARQHPHLSVATEPGKRVFLYLSRMSRVKGLDLLVDAWCAAVQRLQGCDLWIAGADRDGTEQALRRQVQSLRPRGVSMLGSVSEREKDWLLRSCDIFVLPSRGEGQSPAVLEAMAYGKPVLLTNTCFFSEVASAGAGTECDLSVLGIQAALARFAEMRTGELEAMGQRGRVFVGANHDIRSVALRLDEQAKLAIAARSSGDFAR